MKIWKISILVSEVFKLQRETLREIKKNPKKSADFSKMLVQNFRQEKKNFFSKQFYLRRTPVWSPQKWIFMAIRSRTLSLDYHISRKEIFMKWRNYLCFGTYSNGRHHIMCCTNPICTSVVSQIGRSVHVGGLMCS